jgi:hypothetical protein
MKAGCGGGSGPSDSRRTVKIRLGLFKKEPSDLRWTTGIGRPASALFSGQQRWRCPTRSGELAGDKGRGGSAGLRATGMVWEVREGAWNPMVRVKSR